MLNLHYRRSVCSPASNVAGYSTEQRAVGPHAQAAGGAYGGRYTRVITKRVPFRSNSTFCTCCCQCKYDC